MHYTNNIGLLLTVIGFVFSFVSTSQAETELGGKIYSVVEAAGKCPGLTRFLGCARNAGLVEVKVQEVDKIYSEDFLNDRESYKYYSNPECAFQLMILEDGKAAMYSDEATLSFFQLSKPVIERLKADKRADEGRIFSHEINGPISYRYHGFLSENGLSILVELDAYSQKPTRLISIMRRVYWDCMVNNE